MQDLTWDLAGGTQIHGRWCPANGAKHVILHCHGNGGNLEGQARFVSAAGRRLNASVLLFDYPGYGRSTGTPSEAGCYASAQAAYDWLVKEKKIEPDRIVLCGESLGGGVAVELASRNDHAALVLIRTYTSLPDLAQTLYPWLPVHWLMHNRFDSQARLPACSRPVFVAQADQDKLMPFAHAERLRQACAGPCEVFTLRGLGHNDPLPADFFAALESFLERHGR